MDDTDHDRLMPLLAEAGVDSWRLRAVLGLVADGAWWELADLVRATATSRRGVEELMRAARAERSGDRFRLSSERIGALPGHLRGGTGDTSGPRDPVAHLLPAHGELLEAMRKLIGAAPRGRTALDHVAATPESVVRRALLLGERFWLPGARVLFAGDHDLSSLAVAMAHPQTETMVVDVDERILAYIDAQAARLGLNVRTRWCDLRLGLPPSARGWADLALTDPPYTPGGVGLFVARAVEGLRDLDQGRVLLAYGASERTPMLALKVQTALHELNLVNEAIYPDFNRYTGAEAIGSAADLYILRPTTKTLPAVAARADRYGTAIYTQGPQAIEAIGGRPGEHEIAADPAFTPGVLVGDWPKGHLPSVPRARLSTWLARPYAAAPARVALAVPAGLEAALPRLLLASRAAAVRVHLGDPGVSPEHVEELVAPVYEITARDGVLDAVRRPAPAEPSAAVLRGILDNAHGKLANTWREGLIRASGGMLTKRQARAAVTEAAPWADDVTPLELPAHRLRELGHAVRTSLVNGSGTR
ncbi:bis-aminopropyl spermidine synthase family protein [Spongiactinospora sp. TRM90649]|uniref:bis-aminopropyl spermidine synthase family protein n=1 Tax=Spongiactinospora sp. TRM90649 TaxID=3031114 RepID=UPI0023F893B7|nr:bis-aminopropyl spermidine synthase family protein [Spongiactinospora sp. TRM90649]MDF5753670.1 bis-aminopropyl spermidine synthase family protein [Spongiactinospora sp. TRM90649]